MQRNAIDVRAVVSQGPKMVASADVPHLDLRVPRAAQNGKGDLRKEGKGSHVHCVPVLVITSPADGHRGALPICAPDPDRPVVTARRQHVRQHRAEHYVVDLRSVAFECLEWIRPRLREVIEPNQSIVARSGELSVPEGVPAAAKHLVGVSVLRSDRQSLEAVILSLDHVGTATCACAEEVLRISLVPGDAE